MALYEGNEMRSMMKADFSDVRMDKSKELNANMTINETTAEDEYGQQVHSLSKQSYSDTTNNKI